MEKIDREYMDICAKGYQAIREGKYVFAAKYLTLAEQKAAQGNVDPAAIEDLKERLNAAVYKH